MASSYIDALPYFDKQLENPGAKAAAQALIDAELKKTPKVTLDDPRLPPDVEVFPKSTQLAELLKNYENEPIRGIDPSKYGVPSAPEGASVEELAEIEKRGRIGEAHMALRNENVIIQSQHAPNAWLVRNYQLNAELKELQSVLAGMEEQVTDVNRARRVYQEDVGQHLTRLETRWQELVGSTVQLEMACVAMQGEVSGMRERREVLRGEVTALEQAE